MSDVVIVGDGPTGLSAALLLAKNGLDVDVVGADATPVRKALLNNHLALDGIDGPELVERAREHAERFGARLHRARVEGVDVGEPFRVRAEAGVFEGRYLVLATGFDGAVVDALGLERDEHGVRADRDGRTSHDRVYAGGATVRGTKSQVATSVGDGAAIAVDILSRERGKPTHDWDVRKPTPRAPTQATR